MNSDSVSIDLLCQVTTSAVSKPWVKWQSTYFFSPFFFKNLLDSMNKWWAISNLPKLLQPALTMQFRIALNEVGSWWWMYLSITLIVLNPIHSLAFIFVSCCQCVCQTLLNVPNRCPLQCPIFSHATCPQWWRWSVWTAGSCTSSPRCARLSC